MIDNLINQIKGELTGELQDKFQVTPDQASKSVDIAKDSIANGLKNEVKSGNISNLMDMLKGGQAATQNPMISGVLQNYAADLVTKLKLPKQTAELISSYAIPFIMSKLTKDSAGKDLSQTDLMGMLGGEAMKGIGSKLGGLFK